MANIVQEQMIRNLLKTVYLTGVSNALYQNSPILSELKKQSWAGGKDIKYAVLYGAGGAVGSNYSEVLNNGSTVMNGEWTMTPGYMTSVFNVNQPELLSTSSERGAYMKALQNKMIGNYTRLSRTLATYLYGGKYGIIDRVKADASIIAGSNTLELTSAGVMKLDVGSKFVIASAGAANKAVPSSPLLDAVCTVTKINDKTITFTSTAAVSAYAGDYIELYTARNGADVNGIEGLADILPAFDSRTGDNWNTYIGTTFRGIDRSVATERLAGQFVKAASTGNMRKSDALVSLLKKCKRAGGINDIIVLNDETWDEIAKEFGINSQFIQSINTGDERNRATKGLSAFKVAFGDAFIDRVKADPYMTENMAYMFDMNDLEFFDMGNIGRVIDPVANGSMGKVNVDSVGDAGFGDNPSSGINFDKLFTVESGTAGVFGPSLTIGTHVYGNFKLGQTAGAGVADLS